MILKFPKTFKNDLSDMQNDSFNEMMRPIHGDAHRSAFLVGLKSCDRAQCIDFDESRQANYFDPRQFSLSELAHTSFYTV